MEFGKTKIVLKRGDITQEEVDVIVNAANSTLMGGGGVDEAIHRVGGHAILEECVRIKQERGRCSTGEAVITNAGQLKAKKVVHAVGPVWYGGKHNEEELLWYAYTNSLILAKKTGAKSVAFPSISTGVFRFPVERAAKIALMAVKDYALQNPELEEVRFILFSDEDFRVYQSILKSLGF